MEHYNKTTTKAYFSLTRQRLESLLKKLEDQDNQRLDHSQIESLIEKEGREILRQAFQDHLDLRFIREKKLPYVIGEEGIKRTHRRVQERSLRSVLGDVRIKRWCYSAPEEITLKPMDAQLNLPYCKYSHNLVRRLVNNVVKMSFDNAIADLEQSTGARVPKRQAEEQLRLSVVRFQEFYKTRSSANIPKSDDLLILSTDGKGVVMRYKDLRVKTQRRIREAQLGNSSSQTNSPIAINRKRMATVAAVYNTAPNIRTPEEIMNRTSNLEGVTRLKKCHMRPSNKRVFASLMFTPEDVIRQVFEEALRRDPKQRCKWVYLVDGDLSQLRRVRCAAKKHNAKVTIVCDFIHVLEYLWNAAHCFFPLNSKAAEDWVEQKAREVLRGKSSHVAAGMRISASKKNMSPDKRKDIDKCAKYLLNHRDYLKYDTYLSQGFPIASGVIEGTCRHLINDRLDITGARWSLYGAECLLKMRALWASGDLDEYWEFERKLHFESEHRWLYKNGMPPGVKLAS